MIRIIFIALFLLLPGSLFGQEADLIPATVTQLAGQNVYLNIGSEQGVARGDTLRFIEGASERRLVVNTVSRKQCVTQFADSPFAVTRGQRLHVRVLKGEQALDIVRDEPVAPNTQESADVVSVMDATDELRDRRTRRRRNKPQINGRVLLNLAALSSETRIRSGAVAPVSRLFLTPSININSTVSNLPSDMRIQLHIRTDYRYQSRNAISPNNSFRAYQLRLEKTLPFGQIQAGRFYNRLTQRGGYWDGLSFLFGSRKKGIGGSVGFMPDRSNEGFTTQFPRYSLFAHFETPRSSDVTYKGSLTWNEIHPSSEFLSHRYAGLEQRLSWDFLSLNQDLQLDQDPISKSWVVSHLQLSSRINLGNRVQLSGRYTQRQPYRLYNLGRPFLTRRDQYAGGVRARFDLFSVGASYARRYLNEEYEGRTITAFFNTLPLTPLQVVFSGSGNHWESDAGSAIFANAGVARQFGSLYTRLDYGFYRSYSPNVTDPLDLHRISVSTSVPMGKSFYWNVRGSMQQSQFQNSFSINTSLQIRF